MLTILTKPGCTYCDRAKDYLTGNGIGYTELDVTKYDVVKLLMIEQGWQTVPQIITPKGHLIYGGCDALLAMPLDVVRELSNE